MFDGGNTSDSSRSTYQSLSRSLRILETVASAIAPRIGGYRAVH